MATPQYRYAEYPSAKVYDDAGNQINHLLWGDWVRLKGAQHADGRIPVHVRGTDGWMYPEDLREHRVLEVVFVDVGQGDGTLLITPQDKHFVIDAGISDNMYRYLDWRYAGFKKKWTFDAGILTHPDMDHYYGFTKLFEHENVAFRNIYHNGLMEERTSGQPLGPYAWEGRTKYITEPIEDQTMLEAFLADEERWRHPKSTRYDKKYPTLLNAALASVPDDGQNRIRMLSTHHGDGGYVPGYGPGKDLSMRVLSPVVEPDVDGNARLRWFRDRPDGGSLSESKTKNGHSVVILAQYKNIGLLLGGDLNTSAEVFLMKHHTDFQEDTSDPDAEDRLVAAANRVFGADIAKCCHHGSADFSNAFLRCVHPAATVISSGDEESHAHPRCDTLGAIGLYGRGWRPLLFSTELARSTREKEKTTREEIVRLRERIVTEDNEEKKAKLEAQYDEIIKDLTKRNVTVYGSISLRTDGDKAIMAYKLERERAGGRSPKRTMTKWDIYQLERPGSGPLTFVGG